MSRVRSVKVPKPPRATYTLLVEWLLGLTGFFFGLLTLWPGWDVYGTAPALFFLSQLGWFPQWLFGSIWLLTGLLFIAGAIWGTNLQRGVVALLGSFEWGSIYYIVNLYNKSHHIFTPSITLFSLPSTMSLCVVGYLFFKIYEGHLTKQRKKGS